MAHLVMFLYTAFYIGRIHELVAFLRPLRIVLLLGLLGIVLTLTLPRGKRNRVLRQPEVRRRDSPFAGERATGVRLVLLPENGWPAVPALLP